MFLKTIMALILTMVVSCGVNADLSLPESDKDDYVRVGFSGWSYHAGRFGENVTNESHDIFGVEYRGYSIGRFNNSYGRETWFVGRVWRWKDIQDLRNINIVASLGLSKGYRMCFGDDDSSSNICPHGYLGVEYDTGFLIHSFKTQGVVFIYNPEIKF